MLFFLTLLICGLFFLFEYQRVSRINDSERIRKEVEVNGSQYAVGIIRVDSVDKLILSNNLEKRQTSADFMKVNQCTSLVSAGFYTREYKPVGLLISEGVVLEKYRSNSLFDGFLTIGNDNIVAIGSTLPDSDKTRISVQSGPLLFKDGNPIALSIRNDKYARRIVGAVDKSGSLLFLVFYKKDDVLLGPALADLPNVLKVADLKLNLEIVDAINLDGGSASVFKSGDLSLPERSLVGEYFCLL